MSEWTPERIKALRLSLNMTQQQFATQIGSAVASVHRWETGKKVPKGMALVALDNLEAKNSSKLRD